MHCRLAYSRASDHGPSRQDGSDSQSEGSPTQILGAWAMCRGRFAHPGRSAGLGTLPSLLDVEMARVTGNVSELRGFIKVGP
jgi:hypothetical protein